MPSRRDVLRGAAAGSLVGLAGCADETVSGEWPRAGYDRRNTGDVTDRDGPGGSLTTAWTAPVPDGYNRQTPVVVDGRVYVGTADDGVGGDGTVGFSVFDAADGDRLRDVRVTTGPADGGSNWLLPDSLVVSGGAAYLVAYDGVHSYTLDGEERWHRPVDGQPQSTIHNAGHPVVVGDTVFAPTASTTEDTPAPEGLLAIDDVSGELRWRYKVPRTGRFGWTYSVAYAEGTVYLSMLETGVVALAADSGEVEWLREVPAAGPPTVADDAVFVATERGEDDRSGIRALDATTGEVAWRQVGDGEWLGRRIAAADGRIYCREELDVIVCRDAATGDEVWRYAGAGSLSLARPVPMGDAVYAGVGYSGDDEKDGIVALDPATGDRVGGVGLEKNSGYRAKIAASEERLFVSTRPDQVHAVEACTVDAFGRCLH